MSDEFDPHIAALGILCQNYLLIHSDSSGSPDIDPADPLFPAADTCLRKMGLTTETLQSLKQDFRSKRDVVMRPSWWADPFNSAILPPRDRWKRVGIHCTRLVDAAFAGQHDRVHLGRPREIRLSLVVPAYLELLAYTGQVMANESLIVQPVMVVQPAIDWAAIIAQLGNHSEDLYHLPWQAFEDLIAQLLRESGHYVQPMCRTRDGGKDIIAVRGSTNLIVQCKRNSRTRKVDVCPVRELWAIKEKGGYDGAMIATTSLFTKDAIAENVVFWRLELKDHGAIAQWCRALSLSRKR